MDYEIHSKYELIIRATDSVSGAFAEVPVSINVEDSNDSPPEFTNNQYNVTISEATPFGTNVLNVTAHDQDSGINAKIRYRLLPDPTSTGPSSDLFQIHPEDGIIILARHLDRETQAQLHVSVMATDLGNPSLSSIAHIWIRGSPFYNLFFFHMWNFCINCGYLFVFVVEDVNDNPPSFDLRSYRCVLSEDAKRGQFVTMVTATDPDVSDESRLVYSITGGNEQQMFNIDAKSGNQYFTLQSLHLG